MINIFRLFLSIYRKFLNFIFGKESRGLMDSGIEISIENYNFKKYFGDIVHPCIRYSINPIKGHNWWLIYTPYYKANASLENPILCYGESENGEVPFNWYFDSLIRDTPSVGYNSDPTLFVTGDSLNVYWRENFTIRTRSDNALRATYGLSITDNSITNFKNSILIEKNEYIDKEVSPTFIKCKSGYRVYAAHLRFKNEKLHFKNAIGEKISSTLLLLLSLLEIYNEQKSYGIAIWESSSLDSEFKYIKTVTINNCNKLYRPWHFDFFEFENKLYILIQTKQCNADICLGVSDDFENFRLFSRPLLSEDSINKVGIYKPTGFVKNSILYLYYTAQDPKKRGENKLYCTKYPMKDLLEKIDL